MSEWADAERWLSPEASTGLQKWRSRPYQTGVQDSLSETGIGGTVAVWCSQGGKTEICLNLIGRHADNDPAPIMYMAETLDKAKAFSKDRIAPMVRDTPALRGVFEEARARDAGNTLLHKSFMGGHLTMVGANSAAGLSMRPIRVLICDEFAAYPPSAGTEGDPVKLAEARTTEFWNRIHFWISSPRWFGDRAEKLWVKSDQRRWFVPCPHCGEHQFLKWDQVDWDDDGQGAPDPSSAGYACEHCGAIWDDLERWRAIRNGEWRATAPLRRIAGFHLNALSVLGRRLEPIVEQWLEAQGNPDLLQVFINTVLAEWWSAGDNPVEGNELHTRAIDRGWTQRDEAWEVPAGGAVLTAGIDVGADRLDIEVVAWGHAEESWSVYYGRVMGDPKKDPNVLLELDSLLLRAWSHEIGEPLYIRAACVDTGYATQQMYRFCKPRLRRFLPDGRSQFVFGIKGGGEYGRTVWPDTFSQTKKKKLPRTKIWVLGSNAAKDQVAARLAIADAGPGFCHFPAERPLWFFEQLTSEHAQTKYRMGQPYRTWEVRTKGRPNEAFDCRQYAYAALVGVQSEPFLLDLEKEVDRVAAMKRQSRDTARPAAPTGRRRGRRSRGYEA